MQNTNSLKFLVPWILITTIAMMLAVVVGPTTGNTWGAMLGAAVEQAVRTFWKALPPTYLASMIGGAVNGFFGGLLLGFCQWLALRHWIPKAGWWIVLTALGNAIGAFWGSGFFNFVILSLGGNIVSILLGMILSSPITAVCVTFPQWILLINLSKRSFWWLPASLLGWILGNSAVAIGFALALAAGVANVLVNAILGAINGNLIGITTGLALMYIFKQANSRTAVTLAQTGQGQVVEA